MSESRIKELEARVAAAEYQRDVAFKERASLEDAIALMDQTVERLNAELAVPCSACGCATIGTSHALQTYAARVRNEMRVWFVTEILGACFERDRECDVATVRVKLQDLLVRERADATSKALEIAIATLSAQPLGRVAFSRCVNGLCEALGGGS